MAESDNIDQKFQLKPANKISRNAYKLILHAQIAQDRAQLCQSVSDAKENFSFSGLWRRFTTGTVTGSSNSAKLMQILSSYPYLSIYAGKGLLKAARAGSKSSVLKVILLAFVAKGLYSKYKSLNPDAKP